MDELVVDGKPIVPIRGIPSHTGNRVDVQDTTQLLFDPETCGQITGICLVAHYVDPLGVPHSMWPLEFQDMANKVAELLKNGEQQMGLIAALLPGAFVYRDDLEQCLDGFWKHYADRGCSHGHRRAHDPRQSIPPGGASAGVQRRRPGVGRPQVPG